MRDLSGLLATGANPSGTEILTSANGAGLVSAGGLSSEVGSGVYDYGGTFTDASTWGSLIIIINKTGYMPVVIDEPVTDTGFHYIALNESDDSRGRIFFIIEDVSGVPTTGLTPSGAQVKISQNDGPLSTAGGLVVGVGGGVYYYQTTSADRTVAGDLVVVVSIDPTTYKDATARKLVFSTGLSMAPPPQVSTGTQALDLTNLAGWDISMVGGDFTVTPSGDWALLDGPDCTEQSIIRELPENPGAFPRRPQWGGGLKALFLKGQTKANQDKMFSQSRAALLRNPRVRKVNNISAERLTDIGKSGTALIIDVDSVDGHVTAQIVDKPVRNQ